jgi:hypothetical protein
MINTEKQPCNEDAEMKRSLAFLASGRLLEETEMAGVGSGKQYGSSPTQFITTYRADIGDPLYVPHGECASKVQAGGLPDRLRVF